MTISEVTNLFTLASQFIISFEEDSDIFFCTNLVCVCGDGAVETFVTFMKS